MKRLWNEVKQAIDKTNEESGTKLLNEIDCSGREVVFQPVTMDQAGLTGKQTTEFIAQLVANLRLFITEGKVTLQQKVFRQAGFGETYRIRVALNS